MILFFKLPRESASASSFSGPGMYSAQTRTLQSVHKERNDRVSAANGKESDAADKSRVHLIAVLLSESMRTYFPARAAPNKSSSSMNEKSSQCLACSLRQSQAPGETNRDPAGYKALRSAPDRDPRRCQQRQSHPARQRTPHGPERRQTWRQSRCDGHR
jgi:hypothetical protein